MGFSGLIIQFGGLELCLAGFASAGFEAFGITSKFSGSMG